MLNRVPSGGPPPYSDYASISIAVMGPTGSGKSTFINSIAGSNFTVSGNPASCTQTIQTAHCFVEGREVDLIDTPGFDDTTRSEVEILNDIAGFLENHYAAGTTLHGIVYLYPITHNRMSGASRRTFHLFRKLCGDTTLKNVTIVTNMWDSTASADHYEFEKREHELKTDERYFKPALDEGAQSARHNGSLSSAHCILSKIFSNHPQPLLIQKEMAIDRKDTEDTSAGQELRSGLGDFVEELQQGLEHTRLEIETEIRESDGRTMAEMTETLRQLNDAIVQAQSQLDRMKAYMQFDVEKAWNALTQEAKIAAMFRKARQTNDSSHLFDWSRLEDKTRLTSALSDVFKKCHLTVEMKDLLLNDSFVQPIGDGLGMGRWIRIYTKEVKMMESIVEKAIRKSKKRDFWKF